MCFSSKRDAGFAALLALGMGLSGCQQPGLQTVLPLFPPAPQGEDHALPGQGAVSVSIRWPKRSERQVQLIPVGAEAAVLSVNDSAGNELLTLTLTRADGQDVSQAQLDLPVGYDYRVSALMRGPDGETMALGTSLPFSIVKNQVSTVALRLDSFIVTVVGTGNAGHEGEGVPGTQATIMNPSTVATDAAGNLYVAVRKGVSMDGHVIRRVSPDGIITTHVGLPPGSAEEYQLGDGAPARRTLLHSPTGLAVSPEGDFLIADEIYDPDTKNPTVYRLIFIPARDGERFGMAMQAGCSYTLKTSSTKFECVQFAPDGTPYASQRNWVVRVNVDRTLTTIAGKEGDTTGGAGDDGPATASALKTTDGLAFDSHGNLFIADRTNHRIRMLARSRGPTTASPCRPAGSTRWWASRMEARGSARPRSTLTRMASRAWSPRLTSRGASSWMTGVTSTSRIRRTT